MTHIWHIRTQTEHSLPQLIINCADQPQRCAREYLCFLLLSLSLSLCCVFSQPSIVSTLAAINHIAISTYSHIYSEHIVCAAWCVFLTPTSVRIILWIQFATELCVKRTLLVYTIYMHFHIGWFAWRSTITHIRTWSECLCVLKQRHSFHLKCRERFIYVW